MPACECGANRRGEQHRHAFGLAFVPGVDQALGVFEYLGIGLPRRLAASTSALAFRSASILRRLNPMAG